jgi:hypothetical protein
MGGIKFFPDSFVGDKSQYLWDTKMPSGGKFWLSRLVVMGDKS